MIIEARNTNYKTEWLCETKTIPFFFSLIDRKATASALPNVRRRFVTLPRALANNNDIGKKLLKKSKTNPRVLNRSRWLESGRFLLEQVLAALRGVGHGRHDLLVDFVHVSRPSYGSHTEPNRD